LSFRKKSILAGWALTCLTVFSGTHPALSESPPSEPVAFVDNKPITVAAFQDQLARHSARIITSDQKEALLEEMIHFELLYAAALKAGYDKDPDILASLKRLMANKYREDKLGPRLEKITVSDKEIEKYYQAHQADFVLPKKVRAAIIQISVPANASTDKKAALFKRAAAAQAEALKLSPDTRSFGSVAVHYSDHQPTRYRGGDTGWLQPGRNDRRWPDEVMKAVFSINETGAVRLVTTPAGHYLVKLMETRERAPRPLAAVKARARHQLLNEKKGAVERQFYKKLKGQVPVRIDRARLEDVEMPSGSAQKRAGAPPKLPGQ
jgi:hypothetical protein